MYYVGAEQHTLPRFCFVWWWKLNLKSPENIYINMHYILVCRQSGSHIMFQICFNFSQDSSANFFCFKEHVYEKYRVRNVRRRREAKKTIAYLKIWQWFMFQEVCSVGGRGSLCDFWGLEKGYDTVPLLEPRHHCCWLEQHWDQLLYGQHITMVLLFPLTGIWDSVDADAREQAGHAFLYHYFGGKVRQCEVMWANMRQCEVVRNDTSRSEAAWGGIVWGVLKQCEVIQSSFKRCQVE